MRLGWKAATFSRLWVPLAVVLILAFLIGHLLLLTTYPPAFIDEGWIAHVSWNWARTGAARDTMHLGLMPGFTEGVLWLSHGMLPQSLWGTVFSVVGPGLLQARVVSWAFGVLLVAGTLWTASRLYDLYTGLLAALFLVVSWPFLVSSHLARPDVILAAWVMAGLGLAINALEGNRWWTHLLAGSVMGLSVTIHPNGLIFALSYFLLYLLTHRLRICRRPGAWLYAGGMVAGLAVYVAVYVLRDIEAFRTLSAFYSRTHPAPLLTGNMGRLLSSGRSELTRLGFVDSALDFGLIGAGVGYALYKRSQSDQRLLVSVGATLAGFTFLLGNKTHLYTIQLYPALMIMVAAMLVDAARAVPGKNAAAVLPLALAVMFLLNGTWHASSELKTGRGYQFESLCQQLEDVTVEGETVLGSPLWWLCFPDQDYQSSLNLTYYHFYEGWSLTESLEAIRPGTIIVGGYFRHVLVDDGYYSAGPGFSVYNLPREEFDRFLEARGAAVLSLTDPWHDEIDVYRITWDQPSACAEP